MARMRKTIRSVSMHEPRDITWLLKKYRGMKAHCMVDPDPDSDTAVCVRTLENAIEAWKQDCRGGPRWDLERRRIEAIERRFISKPQMTPEAISKVTGTSVATVYRDLRAGCKSLETYFYGVPKYVAAGLHPRRIARTAVQGG